MSGVDVINVTRLDESPKCTDFAPVAVGDFNGDGKLDLAVTNTVSDTVSILLGDGTGTFTLASSPATFAPDSVAAGDFNGDGRLDVAALSMNDTVSILLQAVPLVTLSPTSLNFGTQLFGTTSGPQYVTLTNTGGVALDITSIAASANFSQTNNCGSSVAAGASCTITVTFRPHTVGTITGTVIISDNASNSSQTVSLSGTGISVTLLPASLDFGNQPVGTTSQPQTGYVHQLRQTCAEHSQHPHHWNQSHILRPDQHLRDKCARWWKLHHQRDLHAEE